MAHDYHEGLPGYDAAQILHDGCGECEARAERADHGLSALDRGKFAAAWARAGELNRRGLMNGAHAELPLLHMLVGVEVQLERFGCPIGIIPAARSGEAGS